MRTTLTVDEHLMRELKAAAHRQGVPLKQIVNRTLQAGLERSSGTGRRRAYKCPAFGLGFPPRQNLDLDKALSLAAAIEEEETVRKLALRK